MREAGVFARYRKKYKVTTNSNHKQPVFENVLDRQFSVSGPDQAYVSDITYVWTAQSVHSPAIIIDHDGGAHSHLRKCSTALHPEVTLKRR